MKPLTPVDASRIAQAHALYCQLTGQTLSLRLDRERLWYELLRSGVSLEDLRRVITYLQREIRHGRRYVGALKLSNLLQLDHFEEDLQISRIRLKNQPHTPTPVQNPGPNLNPQLREQARLRALSFLRQFRNSLR